MNVRAQDLDVRFGSTRAVEQATLSLAPGDRAVVLGDAGSGKTTLLKALAGLVRPTGGSVFWEDREVAQLDERERRQLRSSLGMVFQTDAPFDSMTVLENVRHPLLRRQVAFSEANQRAKEALEQVELSAAASMLPERLSGGMRKRAGIARAIVARPQVLLADDPFSGLDPESAARIAALLLTVSKGKTLVVSLSEPSDWLRLERQLQMKCGRIVREQAGE